jgi:hypothetical protein
MLLGGCCSADKKNFGKLLLVTLIYTKNYLYIIEIFMKATLINYVISSPFISSFPKPLDRLEIDFLNNYVVFEKYSEQNFLC